MAERLPHEAAIEAFGRDRRLRVRLSITAAMIGIFGGLGLGLWATFAGPAWLVGYRNPGLAAVFLAPAVVAFGVAEILFRVFRTRRRQG